MKQELFLGIDGGGTKTTASIVTSDGDTAASGNWPGLNYNSVGPEQVTQVLTEVVDWAQGRCAGMGSLRGICVATAGAGNAHARRLIRETVAGTGHCGPLFKTQRRARTLVPPRRGDPCGRPAVMGTFSHRFRRIRNI